MMRGRCIRMLQLEEDATSAINKRTANKATILEKLRYLDMVDTHIRRDSSPDIQDQTKATQEAQTLASAKVPDPKTMKLVAPMYTTCLVFSRTK